MRSSSYEVAPGPTGFGRAVRDGYSRRLPVRYSTDVWDRRFKDRLDSALRPGVNVLDIGGGARPAVPPSERPENTRYVGLDVDGGELAAAPEGSYDDAVIKSAETYVPALAREFDVVLSFMAFEHVRSTEAALANARAYLRPGGTFVAQLAGAFSPSALANRLLSVRLTRPLLQRTQDRPSRSVFKAHYDRCWYQPLDDMLTRDWLEHEVVPLFVGAGYVLFSRPLTAAYIAYEEWAYRRRHVNLATYYLVSARAP